MEVIYNWGLAEWQRRYKEGDKVDAYGLKKGIVSYPQFKRKKDNEGSLYIGGDQVSLSDTNRNSKAFRKIPHNGKQKHQYLKLPYLGWVKMTERPRFIGKDKRSGNITAGKQILFGLST